MDDDPTVTPPRTDSTRSAVVRCALVLLCVAPALVWGWVDRSPHGAALAALGVLAGAIALARDVQYRRARVDGERHARVAREATAARTAFVAHVGHEIRNPLTGVLGYTEILLQRPLSSADLELVRSVRASGDVMLETLNDLLDLSKAEAGRIELEAVPFSLLGLLEREADLAAAKLGSKRVELALDVEPGVPDEIVGDPLRLRQVLSNLASNAVKFTHSGNVTIRATLRASEPEMLVLAIEDTGIGMDPSSIEHAFLPYGQVDSGTARRYGGTGLGLPFVKRLVDLARGRVEVTSASGKGTRFVVSWPFRKPLDSKRSTVTQVSRIPLGIRAVVVHPSSLVRASVVNLLARLGCGATAVESLDELCVTAPAKGAFIAFVADEFWEAASTSGGLAMAQRVRMARLGSLARDESAQASAELPSAPTLRLPATRERIAASILEAMRGPGNAPSAQVRASRRSMSEPSWFPRVDAPRVLVVDDQETNRRVVTTMLRSLEIACIEARGGFEAIEQVQRFQSVELVLMDRSMPGIDGFEAARRIRALIPRDRKLSMVALTADVHADAQAAARDAGLLELVPKPVSFGAISRLTEKYLRAGDRAQASTPSGGVDKPTAVLSRLGGGRSVAAGATVPSEPPSESFPLVPRSAEPRFDERSLRQLLDLIGEDRVSAVVEVFRSDSAKLIQSTTTSARRLDFRQLSHDAHALKGACLSIGAKRLASLASGVEQRANDSRMTGLSAWVEAMRAEHLGLMEALRRFGSRTPPDPSSAPKP